MIFASDTERSFFISVDNNGNPLSKDEAKYLTGIFNMPIINTYFKVTYSERSFSINFDMRIPKYKGHVAQKENINLVN